MLFAVKINVQLQNSVVNTSAKKFNLTIIKNINDFEAYIFKY